MTEIEVLQLKVEDYAETIVELEMQCKEQNAEIERLKSVLNTDFSFIHLRSGKNEKAKQIIRVRVEEIKSEAIKEFAERLKKEVAHIPAWGSVAEKKIDNLVKEMTEKE